MRFALLLLLAVTAQAQPAGYLQADRPYARIWAPTAADLEAAIEEVSFAALRFESAFGEPPPPITVVVTDDPSSVADLDLPDDGRKVLPFWTRRGSSGPADALLTAGAMLRAVSGTLRVIGTVADASPFQSEDEVVAVAGQIVLSLEDWRRAIAPLPVGGTADVTVRRGGLEVVVPVEVEAAPSVRRVGTATAQSRPLSHEAGHFFLVAYVAEQGSAFVRDTTRTYSGAPALPDWIDEGFATFCEIPRVVRNRDAVLARHLGELIPFDTFLTMDHPIVASGLLDQGTGSSGPIRMAASGRAMEALENSTLFYAQSSSLTRYLAGRYGPRVFGRLVNHVLQGATTRAALEAEGIDPDALEDEWRAWAAATTA